ncbi:hypothetical protein MTO96_043570 [Rhipicephalus appendiculatus]
MYQVTQPSTLSTKVFAGYAGLDNPAHEVEDATEDSALEENIEDDLSSNLRDVYSTDGDASKMPERGSSHASTKTTKSLVNNELENQSEGSTSNTQNTKEVVTICPLPLPPTNFKPKGIMKL